MALSAAITREFEGVYEVIEPKAAASDIYYKGAILCYDSNGYVAVPSDTAALAVAGIYSGKAEDGVNDNAYSVAASTYPRLALIRGKTWMPYSSAAQARCGEIFYVSDDGTMTQTAGSKTVGYYALDFKTGYMLFDFRVPDRIA